MKQNARKITLQFCLFERLSEGYKYRVSELSSYKRNITKFIYIYIFYILIKNNCLCMIFALKKTNARNKKSVFYNVIYGY